jgi:hypothetical protein
VRSPQTTQASVRSITPSIATAAAFQARTRLRGNLSSARGPRTTAGIMKRTLAVLVFFLCSVAWATNNEGGVDPQVFHSEPLPTSWSDTFSFSIDVMNRHAPLDETFTLSGQHTCSDPASSLIVAAVSTAGNATLTCNGRDVALIHSTAKSNCGEQYDIWTMPKQSLPVGSQCMMSIGGSSSSVSPGRWYFFGIYTWQAPPDLLPEK